MIRQLDELRRRGEAAQGCGKLALRKDGTVEGIGGELYVYLASSKTKTPTESGPRIPLGLHNGIWRQIDKPGEYAQLQIRYDSDDGGVHSITMYVTDDSRGILLWPFVDPDIYCVPLTKLSSD